MTEYQKTAIASMRAVGETYAKIGARLGISKETVKSFCRRRGIGISGEDMTPCRNE